MLAVNAKYKKQFHYFDFSFAQGKWHCWYEIATSELIDKKRTDTEER